MPKTYVTFGFDHKHIIGDQVFDKDCVAVIDHDENEDGRSLAFEYFGKRFCFEYPEKYFDHDAMSYFPRGFIEVER